MRGVVVSEITVEWLHSKGACQSQLAKFVEQWGDRADVSMENLQIAVDLGLNIIWLARNLLCGQKLVEFNLAVVPLKAEYDRSINPTWDEHEKIIKKIKDDYYRSCDQLWGEYDLETEPRMAECEKAIEDLKTDRGVGLLGADYGIAIDRVWDDYDRDIESIRTRCEQAVGQLMLDHKQLIEQQNVKYRQAAKPMRDKYAQSIGALLGWIIFGSDS